MPTPNELAIELLIKVEAKLQEINVTMIRPLQQAQKALDNIIERDGKRPVDVGTGIECTPARCIEILDSHTAKTLSLLG